MKRAYLLVAMLGTACSVTPRADDPASEASALDAYAPPPPAVPGARAESPAQTPAAPSPAAPTSAPAPPAPTAQARFQFPPEDVNATSCVDIINFARTNADVERGWAHALLFTGLGLAALGGSIIVADNVESPDPGAATAIGIGTAAGGALIFGMSFPTFSAARKADVLAGEAWSGSRLEDERARRACFCAAAKYHGADCGVFR